MRLILLATFLLSSAVYAGSKAHRAPHFVIPEKSLTSNRELNRDTQSFLVMEAESKGIEMSMTFKQLNKGLAVLKNLDLQFGELLEKEVLNSRNTASKVTLAVPIDYTISRSLNKAADKILVLMIFDNESTSQDFYKFARPISLSEVREDLAVDFVIQQSIFNLTSSEVTNNRIRDLAQALLNSLDEKREENIEKALEYLR